MIYFIPWNCCLHYGYKHTWRAFSYFWQEKMTFHKPHIDVAYLLNALVGVVKDWIFELFETCNPKLPHISSIDHYDFFGEI